MIGKPGYDFLDKRDSLHLCNDLSAMLISKAFITGIIDSQMEKGIRSGLMIDSSLSSCSAENGSPTLIFFQQEKDIIPPFKFSCNNISHPTSQRYGGKNVTRIFSFLSDSFIRKLFFSSR
jgi:hypothetical protein